MVSSRRLSPRGGLHRRRPPRHDLPVLPPAALRPRSRNGARPVVREPRRRGALGTRAGARAAPAAVAGHRDGAPLSQPGRSRRRPRQECRAHRRTRRARLRLHRMRHRHAAPATGQSEAPPVPAARAPRRSSTGSASTTTASSASCANANRASWRGILGLNIGKNFDTPNARAAADYVTCLRAVYARASYVTVNVSSPEHQGPARPPVGGGAGRPPRRPQGRAEGARRPPRQVHADRGEDRARPHDACDRWHRPAPRPAEGRRRDRHQHDDRARRGQGTAGRRRSRRACPAGRSRAARPRSWRRSRRPSTARCRSSAWAASSRAPTRRRRSTPARRWSSSTPGSSIAGPISSPNARVRWRRCRRRLGRGSADCPVSRGRGRGSCRPPPRRRRRPDCGRRRAG